MHSQIHPEITDQDLVLALRQGRPEALSWLYDKYSAVLLGLISRMLRNEEAAGVLLQETFVAIWQQKDAYDASRLSLLSWMILIARDKAVAALKSGKYNGQAQSPGREPANQVKEVTTTQEKVIFGTSAKEEKAALDLIYLQGYSCPEAAAELGITVETLRARLRLAGKHLREEGAR